MGTQPRDTSGVGVRQRCCGWGGEGANLHRCQAKLLLPPMPHREGETQTGAASDADAPTRVSPPMQTPTTSTNYKHIDQYKMNINLP